MEYDRLSPCEGEWKELSDEYISLQELHREYIDNLEQLDKVRTKFEKALNHQKYRLTCLETSLKKIGGDAADDKARKDILEKDVSRREAQLAAMAGSLPKKNGLYLSIILGSVNVSILNPAHRFQYKEEYEKFKVTVTLIVLAMAVFNLLLPHRVMDLIFMFLLVWYYCTLTIRESILRVNGSRIKGWWRVHHFIATVMSGVLLVWASSSSFQQFRAQFLMFNLYIGMVQYMQFVYQKGCLYRLKALGDRYTMDITIEGFHSWMWKGLSFLLPFLYVGYAFQLYNAYVLFNLSKDSDAPWPILVLSILFFIVFLGNAVTTSSVIPQKMWARVKREIKMRHTKLDKVSWKHSKSKSLSEERGAGDLDADASKQCSPEEKAEAKKSD